MKIALACVMQESNTFAPELAAWEDFSIEPGESLPAVYGETNTEMAGFLEEVERLGAEPVPLVSICALADGPVSKSVFNKISDLLVSQLAIADFDGLLIALHGAWVAEDGTSADAELARRIRQAVGREKPIVATLDFHANVRPSLLKEVDGVVGYRTYPHIDMAETGRKAARMIHEILSTRCRPHTYWLPIPLLAPPQCATTDRLPIRDTVDRLDRIFPPDGSFSASFFCVQPWLDIPELSSCLVVVVRSPDGGIPGRMEDLAQELWNRRTEFAIDWVEPQELMAVIRNQRRKPVIVSEAYDSPSGGAPGDNPGLLSTLVPRCNELDACLFVVDVNAATKASQIGVGGVFRDTLGAMKDARFGPPIKVEGRVIYLSDGEFVHKGPVLAGKKISMGPTAVLEVGKLKIVVASRPVMTVDPELYRSQKIEPQTQDVIAVKSPSLFLPGYASLMGSVLHLDMPGVCRGNLQKVPFSKIARPMYPLDDFAWDSAKKAVTL
jgi:microcystin degradation protein MlrC